jgi:hypothetical protein
MLKFWHHVITVFLVDQEKHFSKVKSSKTLYTSEKVACQGLANKGKIGLENIRERQPNYINDKRLLFSKFFFLWYKLFYR